jgi:Fe-S-cluster containining protein
MTDVPGKYSPSIPRHRTDCRRCGTCCIKDGPVLHLEDRDLVASGRLPLRALVTLRKGEAVRDPRDHRLLWAGSEMIKLKGTGKAWTCVLYDARRKRCTSYENRPAECRAMACWETAEIEKVMDRPFLSRADLLTGEPLDLFREHEQQCDCGRIRQLADAVRAGKPKAAEQLSLLIRFDRAFREVAVETGAVDAEHLDFFFGRSLSIILSGFGLRPMRTDGVFPHDL